MFSSKTFSTLFVLTLLVLNAAFRKIVLPHTAELATSTMGGKRSVGIDNRNIIRGKFKLLAELSGEEGDLALSLSTRAWEILDTANVALKEQRALVQWEMKLDNTLSELRALKSSDVLMAIYLSFLKRASSSMLNPLQITSFDKLASGVIDSMNKVLPQGATASTLTDIFTDIHFECIESFKSGIGKGGIATHSVESATYSEDVSDDIFPQSEAEEPLVYQFAGLTKRVYERLGRSLGGDFDLSASVQELRLNNWIAPIYARLQRRFVRFVSSNVEEKLEDIFDASYEAMLDKVTLDIDPRYTLPSASVDTTMKAKATDQYPAWDLAEYIVKIIRNSVSSIDAPSIDAKISNKFQSDLSKKMRRLAKAVEKLSDKNFALLDLNEVALVENMLNIGHASAGAVFCMWHIRHNVVGVKDGEGKIVKDFLRPIMLRLPPSLDSAVPDIFQSIPKNMRVEVKDIVDDATKLHGDDLTPNLQAAAALAHSARITAGNDLRALITYNSDTDDWPASRDDAFVVVFSKVLVDFLLFENYGTDALYENLIAMAVLEETIGVREPRNACARGYLQALQSAVTTKLGSLENLTALEIRVKILQRAMVAMMRIPHDDLQKIGQAAFKNIWSFSSQENVNMDKTLLSLARLFDVDASLAQRFAAQENNLRFDKAISKVLLNNEANMVGMPQMGDVYLDELRKLGSKLSMDSAAVDERILYVSAAVLESYIEMALEQNNKMNPDRVETILRRCFLLSKHSLLTTLISSSSSDKKSLIQTTSRMLSSRLSAQGLQSTMKMIEFERQQLQRGGSRNAGWGTSSTSLDDDDITYYSQFLTSLQEVLVKDFTAASIHKF